MNSCTHDDWEPFIRRMVQHAIDLVNAPGSRVTLDEAFRRLAHLLSEDHFGIEVAKVNTSEVDSSLDDATMEYLNVGETYGVTICLTYDYQDGIALIVTSWGDWVESTEQWITCEHDHYKCPACGSYMCCSGDHTCDDCGEPNPFYEEDDE